MTPRKLLHVPVAAAALSLAATLAPVSALSGTAAAAPADVVEAPLVEPVLIGHRGASGYRPEHTLAAYELAIAQGADYIEPDLVSTRDGVLVARHENEIGGTTDVADHPEFAARRTTKVIDGRPVTGWFTEDFTYKELRTLRAKERLPQVRPDNTAYDGQERIPTLDEVIRLARREGVGIYPETKHPTYFDSLGLSLEEPLVAALEKRHWDDADDPVIIQSFETANLRDLDTMVEVPLAQLVDGSGKPYDFTAAGDPRTYSDLLTPAGLAWIATYADGLGAHKDRVLPRTAGATTVPSAVVGDAHDAGLLVHVWTLRQENQFMATNFRIGTDPDAPGDLAAEARAFLDAGVDGIFSDHPDVVARVMGADPVER
ncbi:MAG TPA: glycerophosphodiester phosphodiesterase [Nocardioides sp.]|nr:glycerophosphodiester phosphodiesterase [Nocardioides sp.]